MPYCYLSLSFCISHTEVHKIYGEFVKKIKTTQAPAHLVLWLVFGPFGPFVQILAKFLQTSTAAIIE